MGAELSSTPLSQVIPDRVKGSGMVRNRLKDSKLASVDAAVGKEDSWARKVLAGDSGVKVDDIEPFLYAIGLKVVGIEKVCVDRETAQAYETIAKRAMAKDRTLIWDDAE